MNATLRIVRYIKKSPGLGIFLKIGVVTDFVGDCDSYCVPKSVTGYVVKLGDSQIS